MSATNRDILKFERYRRKRGKQREELVKESLDPYIEPNQTVIDLGTGRGLAGEYIEQEYEIDLVQIDSQDNRLRTANLRNDGDAVNAYGEHLPLKNDSVSTVISLCGLENFRPLKEPLEEIKRVLNDDGALICMNDFDTWPEIVEKDLANGISYWEDFKEEQSNLRTYWEKIKLHAGGVSMSFSEEESVNYRPFHSHNHLKNRLSEEGFEILDEREEEISFFDKYKFRSLAALPK